MKREIKEYLKAVKTAEERHEKYLAKMREIYNVTEEDVMNYETGPKTIDFDIAGKSKAVIDRFRAAQKAHAAGEQEIRNNYKGELLEQKLAAHKASAPNYHAAIAELQELQGVFTDFLDKQGAAALDGGNLSPDYQYLRDDFPGTLTADELVKLHAKHASDPVFCRSLRDYYAAHKDEYGVHLDLRDGVTVQRELVNQFTNDCVGYLTANDFEMRMATEVSKVFDTVTEQLAGNGLFDQPQEIAPEGEPSEPNEG